MCRVGRSYIPEKHEMFWREKVYNGVTRVVFLHFLAFHYYEKEERDNS